MNEVDWWGLVAGVNEFADIPEIKKNIYLSILLTGTVLMCCMIAADQDLENGRLTNPESLKG